MLIKDGTFVPLLSFLPLDSRPWKEAGSLPWGTNHEFLEGWDVVHVGTAL